MEKFSKVANRYLLNFLVFVLSSVLFTIGMMKGILPHKNDIIVMLLLFVMIMEFSKLIILMSIGDEAPIMVRFALASAVIYSIREFYLMMINHDWVWVLISILAAGAFMFLRWVAIKSTKDGR